MKKLIASSLALSALALAAGVASASITDTPHNLTTSGSGPNKQSNTGQICVFCHTPHASNTGASAPLWNKNLPSTTYTTYASMNSSTIDGKIISVGSVSQACLSCHDGTQAMDNMLNAPGSGGYNSTGQSQGYNFTSGTNMVTGVANLGADLRNDHPIGIQYCGGGVTGTGSTVTSACNDSDFVTSSLKTKTVNGNQVFWLDRNSDGARNKTDIILYTRAFSGTNALVGPSVECASCHDPHVSKTDTGNNADVNFMRVTTAGSQICLACHTK